MIAEKINSELESLKATAANISAHITARLTAVEKMVDAAEKAAHEFWINEQKTNLENVNNRIKEITNPPK